MRNYLLFLLFFVVIVVNAQKTEFYRNVHIDDRQCQIVCKDQIDSAVAKKTSCFRVLFDEQNRIKTIRREILGKWKDGSQTDFSLVTIEYSDSTERRFYEYFDKAKKSKTIELVLNKDKFPVAEINYNSEGNIIKDKNCVARYERILNEDGWLIECRFYDAEGNRITNFNGDYFFRYKWAKDDDYYRPELSYYDVNGNLHDGDRGYSITRNVFDKKEQRRREIRYFNSQNRPVLTKNGYAHCKLYYYDNGFLKTAVYLDAYGFLTQNGCCKIEYQYNKFGNIIKKDYYYNYKDSSRHTECTYKYDKNQNVMEKHEKRVKNRL
ncbi:MAG: hypothetical protein LBB53_00855 [Prevotellaceae bacterium]|jgi:hypothetical protein|nr:hypothetical protein [Prevotellaceae bacterium]